MGKLNNHTIHQMGLNPAPFEMIKSGQKKYELRLNDEKRRKLRKDDFIEFTNTQSNQEKLMTKVEELLYFDSFVELYEELPLLECGYTQTDVSMASPTDMEKYYSQRQQAKYGVVGIQLSPMD